MDNLKVSNKLDDEISSTVKLADLFEWSALLQQINTKIIINIFMLAECKNM
jgi:hypothetical protein